MPNIRHVSFDVWKTLIEPNPEYAKARLRMLTAELSQPADKVEQAYRRVKDGADHDAESAGIGRSTAEVYDELMQQLGVPDYNWLSLRRQADQLFVKHPPIVRPDVIEALRALQERGVTLSIGSNTNFTGGHVLHEAALGQWGVEWAFQVFSDQVVCAKPHAHFWRIITERARAHVDVEPSAILHIGDNKICDGGCVSAGIHYQHVRGPEDVASVLGSINVQDQAA